MNEYLDYQSKEFLDLISMNVVKIRKSKGFSQLRLAVEMGYSSASYIGRMEIRKNGEHFNLIHLFKIAKILDVCIEDLFEGTNEIIKNKDCL
ncbi:MAG TPA: transcriptional regulator [Arcobacter skirrowii]|nr:transcriptional regulator [Aliarcobacter skirrowii]